MSDLTTRRRRDAEDVRTRMPWLNAAQAEEVTRHYIRRRIDLTRQMLQGTAQRAAELRRARTGRGF